MVPNTIPHTSGKLLTVGNASGHYTDFCRAERTAEWQTNISNLPGGPVKPQIMTDDGRSWFETD